MKRYYWSVRLVKSSPGIKNSYKDDYFPRQFHYQQDALDLKAFVEKLGGSAEIYKDKVK